MKSNPIRIDAITINWQSDDSRPYRAEGCSAVALVSYPCSLQGGRRLERLTSGGLWGIELESPDDSYGTEIENEELADLKQHLEMFGIDVSGFDAMADSAEGRRA